MKSSSALLAAFALTGVAYPQSPIQTIVLPGAGARVASLGDLDHDGAREFAVGASGAGIAAFVLSGPYGYGLFDLPDLGSVGAPPIAAAGDVNADGTDDIAVGFLASDVHAAALFSGVDGALLLSIPNPAPGAGTGFGHRVVGIGDVNQDGHADVVVTAPHETVAPATGAPVQDSGRARVYSGQDGALLHVIAPKFLGHRFGTDAAPLGDVNADGVADFLVSSLREVDVVSGKTGAVLRVIAGSAADEFGFAVCGVPDANFDGVPDVVVGVPSFALHGRVDVFSGKTGTLVSSTSGGAGPGARFGSALAPLQNAPNGLGRVLVGAPGGFGPNHPTIGMVIPWDIAGNQALAAVGAEVGDGTGAVVASIGDANGDGLADALVCALEDDENGVPRYVVRHMSQKTLGIVTDVVNVSLTTGGTQTMTIDGMAIVPSSYQPVSEIAAGRPYVLLGSASGTTPGFEVAGMHAALNPDAYFAFTAAHVGGGFISNSFGVLDEDGFGTAAFHVPALEQPGLVGLVLHHAAFVLDGPGLSGGVRGISNAAALRLEL